MSSEIKVPRLKGEALEWAENALSIPMPYQNVVNAFLDTFPYYVEEDVEGGEGLEPKVIEEKVKEILLARFQRMRRDTRRKSYQRILEKKATLNTFLDCIPIASALTRIVELEIMRQELTQDRRQSNGLKTNQLLKVIDAARREADVLLPRERSS